MPDDQTKTKHKTKKSDLFDGGVVGTVALGGGSVEPHVKVEARVGESTEQLLRRFNREVYRAGIMKRLRELEFYEKPSKRKQREEKVREQIVRKYSE